jgi:spermidine synthase
VPPTRRTLLRAAGAGLLAGLSPGTARSQPGERILGEGRSRYNHVRIAQRGSVRTMYFVGDDGTQYVESRLDLSRPQSLDLDYARTMMAGFLLQPRPQRALMLGLGGGQLSNYLHDRFPALEIDTIEIDPEVVRLAQRYFNVPRDDPRYRNHVGDGRLFVESAEPGRTWDLIILDAFRGVFVPYHLKTAEFYEACLRRLSPAGVVVANLHNATRMYPHDRADPRGRLPAALLLRLRDRQPDHLRRHRRRRAGRPLRPTRRRP